MATGSSLTQNYSRSQSEIHGVLHKVYQSFPANSQMRCCFMRSLDEAIGPHKLRSGLTYSHTSVESDQRSGRPQTTQNATVDEKIEI
ncbi:hypothetical protein TNCV_3693441 [Trichonephila clavipes]|nr:hypothetical protein TNCV_3693441 [Trichonephila clavipes]